MRANWIFDFRSGFLYDSNVSRSNESDDILDDAAWRNLMAAGQQFQLTDDLRLGVFGEVESHVWLNYYGLDNITPAFTPNLRYRFGLGRNAPWIRFETKAGYADFQESRRSGWELREGLRGGVSLTDRITLEASFAFSQFLARDSVFEQHAYTASLRANWDVTSSLQIAIGYAYRYGDVNSYAVPPRPDLVQISEALEPVDTFDTPYVAYRFNATTNSGSIAFNQALNRFAALQASYEFQYTTHDALHYTNHVAQLGLAFSF